MRVRLGFSVAAHLEPDILLLDEVLAVGDAAFQKKCLGKLDNVATTDGRTVLFVSHDTAAILSLCERVVLLENGKVSATGPTEQVVDQYLRSVSSIEEIPLDKRTDIDHSSDKSVIATFLKIENMETGKPIRPTSQIIFRIGYRSKNPVRHLIVQLSIRDSKTGQAMTFLDSDNSCGIPETSPPEGTIICVTEKSYITPGRCVVDIRFMQGMISVFNLENAGSFNVEVENVYGTGNISRKYGTYLLGHKWSFKNGQS
jgi:lipopolysaccharide transport system ATP-binding protein